MIIAAVDGSSLRNPGPSGWAWVIDENNWSAGGFPDGTNNQGELLAVINLLEATGTEPLHIICDSQYVINIVEKWLPGWKRRGWRKADNKPILNLELVQRLDALLAGRKLEFEWTKGHAGHHLNELADNYARDAATAIRDNQPVITGPGFAGAGEPCNSTAPITSPPTAPSLFEALDPDEVTKSGSPEFTAPIITIPKDILAELVELEGTTDQPLAEDFICLTTSGNPSNHPPKITNSSNLEVVLATEVSVDLYLLCYRRERNVHTVLWQANPWQKVFHR